MDARLILAGRSPDFAGSMARGTDLAMRQVEAQRGNALAQLYQTQGPGIAAGDPAAVNALAQFDPMAAQGVRIANEDQQFRRGVATEAAGRDRQRLEMEMAEAAEAGKARARELDAATAAAQAEELKAAVAGGSVFVRNGDRAGWERWVVSEGLDPAQYRYEDAPSILVKLLGISEGMKAAGIGETPALPAGVVELQWRAQQAGLQPGTPEYQAFIASEGKGPLVDMSGLQIGGTGGGPQIGTIPQGYAAVPDATDPSGYRMMPISGGPEDMSGKRALQEGAREVGTQTILNAATRARKAAEERTVGGFFGQVAANNPASTNADLYRQVDVLKATATIENLTAMRLASPTGGALGALTEKEGAMLAAKAGALDPASQNFLRDLADYELTLLQTIHGPAEGQAIFDATRTDPPPRAGLTNAAPPAGAPVADDPLGLFQ